MSLAEYCKFLFKRCNSVTIFQQFGESRHSKSGFIGNEGRTRESTDDFQYCDLYILQITCRSSKMWLSGYRIADKDNYPKDYH